MDPRRLASSLERGPSARPVSRLLGGPPCSAPRDAIPLRKEPKGDMNDYTPHQKKIIDRYYKNFDAITFQRLSELATDLYLAEGKQRDRLWKRAGEALAKIDFPASRIAHLLEKRDPQLLVGILKELDRRG